MNLDGNDDLYEVNEEPVWYDEAEDEQLWYDEAEEEERRRCRRERLERMRHEKERRIRLQRFFVIAAPVAVLLLVVGIVFAVVHGKNGKDGQSGPANLQAEQTDDAQETQSGQTGEADAMPDGAFSPTPGSSDTDQIGADADGTPGEPIQPAPKPVIYTAQTTADTAAPPEEVESANAVFVDLASGNILAQRDYKAVINPASMTKVLTVLVAAEHVTDLDDTFTITIDITDYSYVNDCSSVGFSVGEAVTIRDLFYGTVLPSGADAAVALATYVAGSHEAFVEMMNEKVRELGLSDSAHFTNCVGLYNEAHHCSVYDLAMIMEAAVDNDLCREVLSAHTYTTSMTEQHPEGITISNWFLRRIEDKDTGGEVICGKTGYVTESRNCAVSYGMDKAGNRYICVTAGARNKWRCIKDHVALYKLYAKSE